MLPTIEEAKIELEIAEKLNPGPWIEHSLNVGIAARNIAKKVPGMDANKAYIVGMLHDIGRRVGIVNTPQHVYEGYKYAITKGWDEVARVCMTHSYPLMKDEFDYTPETEEEIAIKEYIMNCQADDYDRCTGDGLWICNIGKTVCGCDTQIWNYGKLHKRLGDNISKQRIF